MVVYSRLLDQDVARGLLLLLLELQAPRRDRMPFIQDDDDEMLDASGLFLYTLTTCTVVAFPSLFVNKSAVNLRFEQDHRSKEEIEWQVPIDWSTQQYEASKSVFLNDEELQSMLDMRL